jgi:hypothetical protein
MVLMFMDFLRIPPLKILKNPSAPSTTATLLQPLQGDPWWRRRPHHQARVLLASLSDGTQWCHVILDNDNNNNNNNNNNDNGSQ